jgi:predicted RNA binding protein YcfA (HicA-like mRNA interferase family)
LTAKEAIRKLKAQGSYEVRQVGSHKQFQHPDRPETVTVPVHKGELTPGVAADIKRKAGW